MYDLGQPILILRSGSDPVHALIAEILHCEGYPWRAELPTTGFEETPPCVRLLVLAGSDVDATTANRRARDWLTLEAPQAVAGLTLLLAATVVAVQNADSGKNCALHEWNLDGQTQHGLVHNLQAERPLALRETARGG